LSGWLSPMLFDRKTIPKHRIAKRMFGLTFPFERRT
jgi:hypothetical protein